MDKELEELKRELRAKQGKIDDLSVRLEES